MFANSGVGSERSLDQSRRPIPTRRRLDEDGLAADSTPPRLTQNADASRPWPCAGGSSPAVSRGLHSLRFWGNDDRPPHDRSCAWHSAQTSSSSAASAAVPPVSAARKTDELVEVFVPQHLGCLCVSGTQPGDPLRDFFADGHGPIPLRNRIAHRGSVSKPPLTLSLSPESPGEREQAESLRDRSLSF